MMKNYTKVDQPLTVSIATDGLSQDELVKIEKARIGIELALNSEKFKEFCYNYSYNITTTSGYLWWKDYHTVTINGFADNLGLSNEMVYKKIMSGAETLNNETDHVLNIFLKIDRRNRRGVLGYTYANTQWQWIYNWFFRSGTIADIAGNLAHEGAGHKNGFTHDRKRTVKRKYSVPYAVGFFVRDYVKANTNL